MKKNKPPCLIKTNPYLQNPEECDAWLTRSVISSSAIEGVGAAAGRELGVAGKAKETMVGTVVVGFTISVNEMSNVSDDFSP